MNAGDRERILVVEDDAETARLLQMYLEDAGYEVLVTGRGDEGLELAMRRRPDVVLLDLMLPGLDGMEVCRRLRERSDVPILMLTARTLEEDRLAGFDLGADDYIQKPFSPREVVRRVRAVLRRASPEESPLLRFAELELDPERHTLCVGVKPVELTATEFRILATLMSAPARVFNRTELVEAAFDRDFDGLERTVDAHVGNLRRKLGSASGLVETVQGVGYRLAGADRA
jgi:two-component system alkaline phosphatase synthesis response regulator PhoP